MAIIHFPKKTIRALQMNDPAERIQNCIIKNSTSFENNLLPEDQAILFNMRGLHEEIYNKDRFRNISVIIIDYGHVKQKRKKS